MLVMLMPWKNVAAVIVANGRKPLLRWCAVAWMLLMTSTSGCTQSKQDQESMSTKAIGSNVDAVRCAEAYLKERGEDLTGNYKASAKRDGESWVVLFESDPPLPGGHTLVTINKDGEITSTGGE